jgi:hypothetical protein
MEVCYWALLFMPLVILHHLLNVFVQLANKRGFKQKKNSPEDGSRSISETCLFSILYPGECPELLQKPEI